MIMIAHPLTACPTCRTLFPPNIAVIVDEVHERTLGICWLGVLRLLYSEAEEWEIGQGMGVAPNTDPSRCHPISLHIAWTASRTSLPKILLALIFEDEQELQEVMLGVDWVWRIDVNSQRSSLERPRTRSQLTQPERLHSALRLIYKIGNNFDFGDCRYALLLVQHFMTLTLLAFVFSILTVFVVYWMNGQCQGRNLPPGPKKYPLIGSFLSMPSTLEWETFANWGQEYSPWCIERYWTLILCLVLFIKCLVQILILFMSTLWGDQWLSWTRTKSPPTSSTKDPVSTPAGKQVEYPFPCEFTEFFLASIRPHFTMLHEL